jgi:uncharacterized membrane protein (GlpM family)
MDPKAFILYFLLGGLVVSLIAYFGSIGKGIFAAFIAFFPSVTLITFFLIQMEGGIHATISYANALLYLTPAWILYILAVILLLPKGFTPAISVGILVYLLSSFITIRILGIG